MPNQLELKSLQAGEQSDPNIEAVVNHPDFMNRVLASFEDVYRVKEFDPNYDKGLLSTEGRQFMDRYLKLGLGFSEDMLIDMTIANEGRITNEDTGEIHWSSLLHVLRANTEHVQSLGMEKLELLREKTGIINLDNYSSGQLERMVQFVTDDQQLIEQLKKGDVTVVFADAMGDYNGAFQNGPKIFENPSGRTLYFEVEKEANFYQYMGMLNRAGVKPSTLIVNTHGSPGSLGFGIGMGRFSVSNNTEQKVARTLLEQRQHSLRRLVRDYMQDSRGIDEPDETIGRRRIIFNSCSMGVENPTSARKETGGNESLPETVLRLIDEPNLEVFAPEVDIIADQTADGLRWSEVVYLGGGAKTTRKADALRYYIDAEQQARVDRNPSLRLWKRDERLH